MFDIGFFELVLIATISLLVIGPERLPSAIRTGSLYLRRIKRSFSDIRQEIEQELHNDAIMQDLKKTRDELGENAKTLQNETSGIHSDIEQALNKPLIKTSSEDVAKE
ncbi:MAG: Sec-independent protein translocase protein TatB [Parahaliea sp.]